jgi:drug/metabolite transporter (DMT)-like permease
MKKNTNKKRYAIILAIGAAALYGLSAPISKFLLVEISPIFMAALLYLGAGIGMFFIGLINKKKQVEKESNLEKKDLKYIIGMIVLDIVAPFLLMLGLTLSNASTVSLLNNFEIVATTFIAMIFFREAIGKRMWVAIILIMIAGIILSFEDISKFSLSIGSIFVILAAISWGLENNCTRMLSLSNPVQIVVIKGFGSGIGALLIAIIFGQLSFNLLYILLTLFLGFIAYGLSIYFYVSAQRELGAARTSAYYAVAPFIGVILSFIILRETINIWFVIALAIMLIGTYFAVTEKHNHIHTHLELTHNHRHTHDDLHHSHIHVDDFKGEHSHPHTHEEETHDHDHYPDLHHDHKHKQE